MTTSDADARRRPPTRSEISIDIGGTAYKLYKSDPDALLEELIENDGDIRSMPYWADLWPSAIALARTIGARPEIVRGKRIFELGCGLGLGAIACANAGAAHILAVDYLAEALEFTQDNAALNGVADIIKTERFDWKVGAVPKDFDLLIAADILYDKQEIPHLSALLSARTPRPFRLMIAEPGRPVASDFFQRPSLARWRFEESMEFVEYGPSKGDIRIIEGRLD